MDNEIISSTSDKTLWVSGLLSVLCVMLSFVFDQPMVLMIPIGFLFIGFFALNIKVFYFLLIASIPICLEVDLPGGVSTDLPSEPLCVALMFGSLIYIALNYKKIDFSFLKHPLVLLILITWLWAVVSSIQSVNQLVSLKYCLSKVWFITTYFFFTIVLVNQVSVIKSIFWWFFIPLFFTVIYTLIKHSTMGFSFADVNNASLPFYRNHVMYAATITVFYPFIWLASTWYKKGTLIKLFLELNKLLFVLAIFFSYTRACLLALAVGFGFYYTMKFKLVKTTLTVSFVGILLFLGWMFYENNYLKFAPEYTRTIYHDSYDNHLEATFEGHDASSMERVNMWIAALKTFPHYPIFGTGPGNFYPTYKSYMVVHFNTWVSDNEQHLSCHNYFLLTLVEQGIVGILLFLMTTYGIFYFIEKYYIASKNESSRNLILALGIAFVMLYVNLTLSDLIETTKIGSLFFVFLALLVQFEKVENHNM